MFDSFSCCRLCLQNNAGEKVDCVAIKGLKNAIQNIFGFEVCKDDNCSTKICKECSYKVTNFSLYKDTVLRNQKCLEEFKLLQSQITENPLKLKLEKSEEIDDVVIVDLDADSSIEKENNDVSKNILPNSDLAAKIQRLENKVCNSKISSHDDQEPNTSFDKTVRGMVMSLKSEVSNDVVIDKTNPDGSGKDSDDCKTPLLGPPAKVQRVKQLSANRNISSSELESCTSSNNTTRHTSSPKIGTSISSLNYSRRKSAAKDEMKESVSSTQVTGEQDKPFAVVSGIFAAEVEAREKQNMTIMSPQTSRSPTVTSTRYVSHDLSTPDPVYIDDGHEIDLMDSTDVPKMPILSGVFSLARDSPIARLIELTNNTNRIQGKDQNPRRSSVSDQEFISVDQFFTRQTTASSSTRLQYNEENKRGKYRVTLTRISDRLHIKLTDALNNEVIFTKLTISGRQAVNRTLSTPPHSDQLKRAMKTNVLDQYSVQLLHFVGLSSILNV